MKKSFVIAMVLLLSSCFLSGEVVHFNGNWGQNHLFNVVSESPSGVEIVFSIHEMVIEEKVIDGKPMKAFGIPGIFLHNEEGAPDLYGTGRYIAIPQGAQAQVTILDSRTEIYHDVEIAPAPNIPFEIDDSPLRYIKNMQIYGSDAYYPEIAVRLSESMEIRGVDVVILGITPFQYNPITKDLIVYKDIRVRVDFNGGNGHFGEDRLRSRFWEPILQGHLVNYNSLPRIDFYSPDYHRGSNGYEYIIIVPDDSVFEVWADTVKAWRKLQGISCEVFTLTEVGGSSTSAIKNFLQTAYTNWDPAPVAFLLLSDYPSSGRPYGITSPRFSHPYQGDYVTDNWYADFTGDNLPDMHHARICAQNDLQLSIMINKFLSYERNPYTSANFYDNPLVAVAWQEEDPTHSARWFQLCGEVIRGFFINSLGKNPARQYDYISGYVGAGCPWSTAPNTHTVVNYWYNVGWLSDTLNPYDFAWWTNGSASGITAAINSGAFLVQHRDHGGETGWGEPPYHNYDINYLTNTMFTFVYSSNCCTGRFDWYSECFTEKFHRSTFGALGVNAASQVSYSFVNDTYIWGTYDGLWPHFDPGYPLFDMVGYSNLKPCMAMTSGKYYLEASSWPYNQGSKDITYGLFHHFGDAFITLYTEIPQDLAVTHPSVLYVGQTLFAVTSNDSSVIALTVDGEIVGVAEGTGTPLDIIVPFQVPDTMKVTVTKANYYRYEADVPIVSPNAPCVGYLKSTIDDVGGNGDGVVNPGETVNLTTWTINYGLQTADDVYGLLSTVDSFVTITQDSSHFGTIVANDSAVGTPDYVFAVDSTCPDSHEVEFDLTVHDAAGSTWVSQLYISVYLLTGISEEVEYILPSDYYLTNAYPNPLKSQTVISYQIPYKSKVCLSMYDASGRLMDVLVDGVVEPGYHSLQLDTKDYASGVYFYRLVTRGKILTRKMIVVK